MPYDIKVRVIKEANYMINTNKTIREISKYFNVSKSTVHDDLSKKLKKIDEGLYYRICKILCCHSQTKHIKGGASTRLKYTKG